MRNMNELKDNLDKILQKAFEKSNTHDILLHQADIIVLNDNKKYLKNPKFEKELTHYLDIFEVNYNISKSFGWFRPSNSVKPDIKINSAMTLFSHHFYNAGTKENYFHKGGKTALCKFKYFTKKALQAKKNENKKKCMRYLSYACHYLADMNEPHHVGNSIGHPGDFIASALKKVKVHGLGKGVFSNHRIFEKLACAWLKGNKNIYDSLGNKGKDEILLLTEMPTSGPIYSYILNEKEDSFKNNRDMSNLVKKIYYKNLSYNIDDYCDYIGHESAKFACEFLEDTKINNSYEQAIAAIRTLNMAETQLARFLYYFFNYNFAY